MAGTAGAVPATMPGLFGGRAPGETAITVPQLGSRSTRRRLLSGLRNASALITWPGHLATTELTSMVSPFKVPVTVAFLPACLSSVARAALSEVSRM